MKQLRPILLFSLWLAACGDDAQTTPDAGTMDAGDPTADWERIVSADGKVTLAIPPGALTEDVEMTMTLKPESEWAPEEAAVNPVVVYEMQPDGLQFASPVLVHFDFPENELQETVHGVASFDATNGLELTTVGYETAGPPGSRRISGGILHFSDVMVVSSPVETTMVTDCTDCFLNTEYQGSLEYGIFGRYGGRLLAYTADPSYGASQGVRAQGAVEIINSGAANRFEIAAGVVAAGAFTYRCTSEGVGTIEVHWIVFSRLQNWANTLPGAAQPAVWARREINCRESITPDENFRIVTVEPASGCPGDTTKLRITGFESADQIDITEVHFDNLDGYPRQPATVLSRQMVTGSDPTLIEAELEVRVPGFSGSPEWYFVAEVLGTQLISEQRLYTNTEACPAWRAELIELDAAWSGGDQINNMGQVLGSDGNGSWLYTPGSGISRPANAGFLTDSGPQPIPTITLWDNDLPQITVISDSGVIAGNAVDQSRLWNRAFLYMGGSATEILSDYTDPQGAQSGTWSIRAVNDFGRVVGGALDGAADLSGSTPVSLPRAPNHTGSSALFINNDGIVAGSMGIQGEGSAPVVWDANGNIIRYDSGEYREIQLLSNSGHLVLYRQSCAVAPCWWMTTDATDPSLAIPMDKFYDVQVSTSGDRLTYEIRSVVDINDNGDVLITANESSGPERNLIVRRLVAN